MFTLGWRFHKSFKILTGVRLNIGKKGISSLSVGPRGAKLNLNNKGTKLTTSIPGTGISHTIQLTQRLDTPIGKNSTACPFCGHHMRKQWDNCPKCKQSLIKNIPPPSIPKTEIPIIDAEYKEIAQQANSSIKPVPPQSKKSSCPGCFVIIILLSLISSCLFGGSTSKKEPTTSSISSSIPITPAKESAAASVPPQNETTATPATQTQETPLPEKPVRTEKSYYGNGPNGEGIKGHIDRKKGTMIYHLPGDPYYSRTTHVNQWFFTEKEAQSAGYRHILK